MVTLAELGCSTLEHTPWRDLNKPMHSEDARYKILRILEKNPEASQRQMAEELGISLGKVNYCLQALVEKGLVKARNFSKSQDKRRYLYVLTPSGIDKKAKMAARFLQRKMAEYEALSLEIEEIRKDLKTYKSIDRV